MNNEQSFLDKVLSNLYEGVYFVDPNRTITFWNRAAEAITGFSAAEVVGTRCMDNILNHVNEKGEALCLVRCPLARSLDDGQVREETLYLHHKKGHRVAVDARIIPQTDATGQIIGAAEIFMESAAEAADLRQKNPLMWRAGLDPEMVLYNRPRCKQALKTRFKEDQASGKPSGMLRIDIDQFSAINKSHGEETGHQVLQMAAASILNSLRPYDFLCRSESSDFVALVKNTRPAQLKRIAERVRILIEHSSLFRDKNAIQVTVSIGATLVRPEEKLESTLARAEQYLQISKQQGRNRVTIDPQDGGASYVGANGSTC